MGAERVFYVEAVKGDPAASRDRLIEAVREAEAAGGGTISIGAGLYEAPRWEEWPQGFPPEGVWLRGGAMRFPSEQKDIEENKNDPEWMADL